MVVTFCGKKMQPQATVVRGKQSPTERRSWS
jgi:hypothetical protein